MQVNSLGVNNDGKSAQHLLKSESGSIGSFHNASASRHHQTMYQKTAGGFRALDDLYKDENRTVSWGIEQVSNVVNSNQIPD